MSSSRETAHTFPLGAWITDRERALTGDIESRHDGPHFSPSSGEVVALVTAPFSGYRIRFGPYETLLMGADVACRECGAVEDGSHARGCLAAPGGLWRAVEHEPGYAPEPEAWKQWEEARGV